MFNIQRNNPTPAIKEEILGLGLRYRLLTQFTSFVAVEQKRITQDGKLVTVGVPVEMPEGVSYEGVFGAGLGAVRSAAVVAAVARRRVAAVARVWLAAGVPAAARPRAGAPTR